MLSNSSPSRGLSQNLRTHQVQQQNLIARQSQINSTYSGAASPRPATATNPRTAASTRAAAGNFERASALPNVVSIGGLISQVLSGLSSSFGDSLNPNPAQFDNKNIDKDTALKAARSLRLATYTYDGKGLPSDVAPTGFRSIDREALNDEQSGFFSELIEDRKSGKVVLAFRGSDVQLNDWIANAQQATGKPTLQYHQAAKVAQAAKRVYGDRLELTGHSLGGGLATYAGLAADVPTHAFDAAGLSDNSLKELNGNAERNAHRIRNFNLDNEFVSDLDGRGTGQTLGGRQIGERYHISSNNFNLPLGAQNWPIVRNVLAHYPKPLTEELEHIAGIPDRTDDFSDVVSYSLDLLGNRSHPGYRDGPTVS